jgi:aspartyl/asparaginyl beta-hydroxylase (cupin superfamily)
VRVRCHFGVDVPEDCGLTVGGETRTWTEGRCMVFDDSFEHEAWNRDVRDRVVLIVDLWHPDLTGEEVRLLEGLDTYVATQSANLARYYARNRVET